MLAPQYLIQDALKQGIAALASNQLYSGRACDALPPGRFQQAVQWWSTEGSKVPVEIMLPDRAPSAPLVCVLLDQATERDDMPIGQGAMPDNSAEVQGAGWSYVSMFRVQLHILCIAPQNLNIATYLWLGMQWALMTFRPYVANPPYGYGLQEQTMECNQLGKLDYPQFNPTIAMGCQIVLRASSFAEVNALDTLVDEGSLTITSETEQETTDTFVVPLAS